MTKRILAFCLFPVWSIFSPQLLAGDTGTVTTYYDYYTTSGNLRANKTFIQFKSGPINSVHVWGLNAFYLDAAKESKKFNGTVLKGIYGFTLLSHSTELQLGFDSFSNDVGQRKVIHPWDLNHSFSYGNFYTNLSVKYAYMYHVYALPKALDKFLKHTVYKAYMSYTLNKNWLIPLEITYEDISDNNNSYTGDLSLLYGIFTPFTLWCGLGVNYKDYAWDDPDYWTPQSNLGISLRLTAGHSIADLWHFNLYANAGRTVTPENYIWGHYTELTIKYGKSDNWQLGGLFVLGDSLESSRRWKGNEHWNSKEIRIFLDYQI